MGEFLNKALDQLDELCPEPGKEYTVEINCLHFSYFDSAGNKISGRDPDGFCDSCRPTNGVHTLRISRVVYSNAPINLKKTLDKLDGDK